MDLNGFLPQQVLGGQCVLSENPRHVLRTVLGSCVSACIYDPYRGIGGMNHFVVHQGGEDEPADRRYRYGDTAMRSLVDRLRQRGARPEQMLAKLYGGRVRKEDGSDPGALNSSFAQAFLHNEGIRIVDFSLGDHVARWVTFHPVSGKVVVKKSEDVSLAG